MPKASCRAACFATECAQDSEGGSTRRGLRLRTWFALYFSSGTLSVDDMGDVFKNSEEHHVAEKKEGLVALNASELRALMFQS